MESDYERKRYKRIYGLTGLVVLLLMIVWSIFCEGHLTVYSIGCIVLVVLILVVVFLISYGRLNRMYGEMEQLSDLMMKVMDQNADMVEEEYREGTIGILYTNFYKMVTVLRESRNREMEEKVFLRDIISDISHQLKTPLASLHVFVDLLLEDKVKDTEKRKQILSEASNQLNRMEWMVLSMLKLARIEAGSIQFEHRQVPLEGVFLQAQNGVRHLAQLKQQKILLTCDRNVMLDCDADWLAEALINLMKNASDYSEPGKRIWLQAEQSRFYTRIYVRDEGIGIAEDELPNIFERFYRVHNEVNPNSVGIGLSLAKSIVEGMGGRITVRSEEGKGTCFTITFI